MVYSKLFKIPEVIFFFIILSFVQGKYCAQTIGNVLVSTIDDTLNINYDIIKDKENSLYRVLIEISSDGGRSFSPCAKSARGDIGYGILPGQNKLIIWDPIADSVELVGNNFVFKVIAKTYGNPRDVEFEHIEGGSFLMGNFQKDGASDENYIHGVTLNNYEMSKYEITNAQFARFLNVYGSDKVESGEFKGEYMIYSHEKGLKKNRTIWIPDEGYENYPVINVTWFGANEFCKYYGYRLPSEAEWEYAAREKGKNVRYGNGKNIASIEEMNFDTSNVEKPHTANIIARTKHIASYNPNNLELFDMSGNVWEWCQDWYESNYYFKSKTDNPGGPWFGKYRVVRGGSWYNKAHEMRVSDRSFLAPYEKKADVGFRPVRSIKSLATN